MKVHYYLFNLSRAVCGRRKRMLSSIFRINVTCKTCRKTTARNLPDTTQFITETQRKRLGRKL